MQEFAPFIIPSSSASDPSIGDCLEFFASHWKNITSDAWVRETVRSGLSLEFLSTPPRFFIECPLSNDPAKKALMNLAIQHLLDIHAIQLVPEGQQGQGFYSILFVIPKSLGGWRAILDLKRLNRHLVYQGFKMQFCTLFWLALGRTISWHPLTSPRPIYISRFGLSTGNTSGFILSI